jgi:hypothetical protein
MYYNYYAKFSCQKKKKKKRPQCIERGCNSFACVDDA